MPEQEEVAAGAAMIFERAIGMGLKRVHVSYRVICLNFNGGSQEDVSSNDDDWLSSDYGETEDEEMDKGEEDEEETHANGKDDNYVPNAKVCREDIKEACNP